jgi:hypothetical protein
MIKTTTPHRPKAQQNSILCFLCYLLFKFFSVLLSLRNGSNWNSPIPSMADADVLHVSHSGQKGFLEHSR